jgi:hypothetical protein
MEAIPKIRCPGCDSEIQATASICPTCMRCPSCGKRRIASEPRCVCGHPDDLQQLERLVDRFSVGREPSQARRKVSRGVRALLLTVLVCIGLLIAVFVVCFTDLAIAYGDTTEKLLYGLALAAVAAVLLASVIWAALRVRRW